MLNAFEQRLADLLADALAQTPAVDGVVRAGGPAVNASASAALITARVLSAAPREEVGDDRRELLRVPGGLDLRTLLRLSGEVLLEVTLARALNAGDAATQRASLMEALDALLAVLQDSALRSGEEFDTDEDQGFELDSFVLRSVDSQHDSPDDVRAFRVLCRYSGRFWPVEPALAGPAIERIPTRIAVLPAKFPASVRARASDGDVRVPIEVDLRELGGARGLLVARLLGSTPPGALVPDSAGAPAGSAGFAPQADGRFEVVYRPPASLAGQVRVRVRLGLASAERGTLEVGELSIEVRE